jgi:hypothetical protein
MTGPTYELCYDPRDHTVLIYRSIPAGICGPFSETRPCRDRKQAEALANALGYARTSAWTSHRNYDSADLIRLET